VSDVILRQKFPKSIRSFICFSDGMYAVQTFTGQECSKTDVLSLSCEQTAENPCFLINFMKKRDAHRHLHTQKIIKA
jgi:hypothetical protein